MEYLWFLWSSLRPWITWAWAWIKANHEPLTVVVTFLGVLVAWRYVVLTRRLAEAANTQAGAARIAAEAAADQARTTRLMFETHRPVLRIQSEHAYVPTPERRFSDHGFTFRLENHGTVPAIVTGWDLSIRRGEEMIRESHKQGAEVGVAGVAPQTTSYLIHALTEQVPFLFPGDRGEPVAVEATVTYRGITEKTYITRERSVLTVRPQEGVRFLVEHTAMDEG